MTVGDGVDLLFQDLLDLVAVRAVDDHRNALVQKLMVRNVDFRILQGKRASVARQFRQLQDARCRVLGSNRRAKHGLHDRALRVQDVAQRIGNRRYRERAAKHDEHRGRVDERLGRASKEDRCADQSKPGEQPENCCEIHGPHFPLIAYWPIICRF